MLSAALLWLTVIVGTYIVFPPYRATPPAGVTIPPGVDVSHFYPIPADEAKLYVGLKPDDRMVLFVGRIEPLKGVDTLIQAMSSPIVVTFQPAKAAGGISIARLVLPHAEGKAAAR